MTQHVKPGASRPDLTAAVDAVAGALAKCAQHEATAKLLRDALAWFLKGNADSGVAYCRSALVALPDLDLKSGRSFKTARSIILRAIDLAADKSCPQCGSRRVTHYSAGEP